MHALAHGLLLAWALAWATFVAVGAARGIPGDSPDAVLSLLVLGILLVVAWSNLFLGGLVLLATGVEALLLPAADSARYGLGLPALLLGLLFLFLSWRQKSRS